MKALFEQLPGSLQRQAPAFVLDPEPFSDAEDRAVASGLRGVRLNAEGEVGYFGLVASNSTDSIETIPFFAPDREAFLEYERDEARLQFGEPKNVWSVSCPVSQLDGGETETPMGKRPQKPWMIMGQIRDLFEVRDVAQSVTAIPSGLDV